jgi:hypothetical protein
MIDEYEQNVRQPLSTTVVVVLSIGVAYFVIGYVFGELDDLARSHRGLVAWRLGAYLASALVYAVHIRFEYAKRRNSTATTALHASLAVAFGAFLLAVAAILHALFVSSSAPLSRYLIALVAWPIFTSVPAFVVAFIALTLLGRWIRVAEQ